MNFTVLLSLRAEADVLEIADWLAVNAPGSAERLVKAINDTAATLTEFPERGAPRHSEVLGQIRMLPLPSFANHLMFYSVDLESRTVLILRVVHGARNLKDVL